MNKHEKLMRAQSQACNDYMKFLDNQIMIARRKEQIRVVEKVQGTNSVLIYFAKKP